MLPLVVNFMPVSDVGLISHISGLIRFTVQHIRIAKKATAEGKNKE